MAENRNGLIVDARLTKANDTAERPTALDMINDNAKPGSAVGAKNYNTSDFVAGVANAAGRAKTTPIADPQLMHEPRGTLVIASV